MVYWLYILARGMFRLIFRFCFRWQVEGVENLPRSGPVILCANHFSWWDPPLAGSAVHRPVFFLAKEELFRYPILGKLLKKVGAIPVRRGAPDRAALRRALSLLANGHVVGIFPEGTRRRDGQLGRAEPGAALLAIRSQAPIVPMAIMGPYRMLRPIRVRIGQPLLLADTLEQKVSGQMLEAAGAQIMARIGALMTVPVAADPGLGKADADRLPAAPPLNGGRRRSG